MEKLLTRNRKAISFGPQNIWQQKQARDEKGFLTLSAGSKKIYGGNCTRLLLLLTILFLNLPARAQSISGTASVCVGSTTALSTSGSGGNWSSGNTEIATVSTDGVVTGVAAGTATISYGGSGGYVTADVTVNSLPSAGTISGANAVCILSGITLTSSVSGGVWSANNAIATVGSTTGIVTGAALGSDSIKYTVTNGCGSSSAAVDIQVLGVVGSIYTLGGTGTSSTVSGDGVPAFQATVNARDLVADNSGNVYFCDPTHHIIRMITTRGILKTIAGTGTSGNGGNGGPASAATLNAPNGVFVDGSGNIFIANTNSHTIRKIDGSTGVITTIAGTAGTTGYTGDGGPATAAKFNFPLGLCTDAAGNIYVADEINNAVRKIAASTGIITTIAGNGTAGYTGDGGPATAATLHSIRDVKLDNSGNLYIADASNNVIRKVVLSTGIITTLAGTGTAGYSGDGGPASAAQLTTPARFAYDGANILYISDQSNNAIRQINLATGIISKVAGNGTAGYSGDFSDALGSNLWAPAGIAVDHFGNFIIADANNNRIRLVPSKGSISASMSSGATTVCSGTPISFSSFVSVAGSASYQWQRNGTVVGTSSSYTASAPLDGDVYRYIVTITPACSSAFADTSNDVHVKVDRTASAIMGAGDRACIGGTLNLIDSAGTGTWTTGNTGIATIDNNGSLSGVSAGSTSITYSVTNTCGTSSAVTTATVNPMVTISANVGPNGTIAPTPPVLVCQGTSQIFTFTPNPGYHVAGVMVDGTLLAPAPTYTFTAVAGDHNIDMVAFEPDCAAPAITVCPSDITTSNDAGACGAVVSYTGATVTGTSPTISYSTNSGESFSVGTTTVTVSATNSCGTATCSFNVTVNDTQAPTITAPSAISVSADAGSCNATITSLGTPTTADNCGVASVTNDHSSNSFAKGTTTVTWTVTDANGNTATATQNVTVTDDQSPAIAAPSDITTVTNTGCTATGVSVGTPVASDNCSGVTVTNDLSSGSAFVLGSTVITWSATDASGNSAAAIQTVTVTDNENPTITAPANITVNADAGSCNATITSLGTPTTADNCSVASVNNNHSSASYPTGTTTVTWTVTDGSGNTATATQTVTVVDNQNPTITAPASISVNANAGSCNATVTSLGTPTTADNCGVASVTNDHSSTTYATGNTTVTWTVTDGSGNTATATQTVTVVDNQNPVITAPSDVTVAANTGCTATGVSLGTPVTTDNCSVATVTNNMTSGSAFALGGTVITWTVTDGSGNTATATQTVTVTDNVNPTITAPANITVNADAGSCNATITSLGTPATADNCSVASVTNNHSSTSFPTGTTTVTWTVTDGSGNTATATQTVTVTDNQNPVITAPADVTISGWCRAVSLSEAAASLGTPTTSDNCGVASVSNNAPSTFAVGATTVTWTVTDVNGNTATATQTVTVNSGTVSVSATAANTSCNSANGGNHTNGTISTSVSGGNGTYSYAWSTGATTANVSGLSTGTYNVTVTDGHSCTATASATVGQPTALAVAALTPTGTSCNTSTSGTHNNGSISLTMSGGTGSCTYSWSNGATSANPTGLSAGAYSVTATDANGCTTTGSATVSQPGVLAVSTSVTNVSCNGSGGYNNDGSITCSVSGGTTTYAYSWSCGATVQNPSSLAPGCYSVTVTDAHSCTTLATATIATPTTSSSTITGSASILGGTTNTYTGPSGMSSYSWTISGGDHICDAKCHHNSGHTCGVGCDHYGVSCPSSCHHHSGHVCSYTHIGDHHCSSFCHHGSGHTCTPACDHYGHACTTACHHNSGHECGHAHCGSASISGSATGSSVTVVSSCCASTYTLTLTTSNSGGCSSTSTKAVTVNPSTTLTVYSALYSVGAGIHPGAIKSALASNIKIFDRHIVGARNFNQSNYNNIWNSTTGQVTNVTVSSPVTVSFGSAPVYKYTVTVPAGGHYLILGKSEVASTRCGGSTCTIYEGRRFGGHESCDGPWNVFDDDDSTEVGSCSSGFVRFLQVIKDHSDKVTEADTHQEFGSLMLTVTPVALSFDDSVAYLPVVYESVEGDWSTSVTADPPYGFYAVPNTALTASVTDSLIDAVQFAITDTGSEWTFTNLTHQIMHKGAMRTAYSKPGMVNERTNKPVEITLSPNPANDQVRIKMPKFEGKATINVYDMVGQKVAEQPIEVISGGTVSMDISSLAAGVYMVTAENKQGKAVTRLVKNAK